MTATASTVSAAMVLAAGMGTRMRPLTDTIPKPLVPLAGRPLIDHVLDRIAAAGIGRAVVNLHHHADLLQAHLGQRFRPEVILSDERGVLLDTGGGVMRAMPLLGQGPYLIHNSDSVWIEGIGSNLTRLIEAWDGSRMDSLMLVASPADSLGYDGHGDFVMDGFGALARRPEGREAPFVFAGVSIAHPRMFDQAPNGKFSLNRLWDQAITKGRLFGLRLEGTWMHVGTPEALAAAEARIAERG